MALRQMCKGQQAGALTVAGRGPEGAERGRGGGRCACAVGLGGARGERAARGGPGPVLEAGHTARTARTATGGGSRYGPRPTAVNFCHPVSTAPDLQTVSPPPVSARQCSVWIHLLRCSVRPRPSLALTQPYPRGLGASLGAWSGLVPR